MSGHIDCDGPRGRNGHHGSNGHSGGGHGSDAGDGQRGADSRNIDLTLTALTTSDAQILSFHALAGRGVGRGVPVGRGSAGARDFDQLSLSSVGGDGGTGGNGGDGGNGSRGQHGRDATRHSSGGDGGRGGRGGDAGAGGSGGDAGAGGRITVHVQPSDTYLLMAVDGLDEPGRLVRGGTGGRHGHHGSPGSGGPGGRGGRSYTWTTTDKNRHTHHHRNSGGSSGPRGASGRSCTRSLHHGANGSDGTVDLMVGEQRFGRRYQLYVRSFTVVALGGTATPAAARDGVFEFGERCAARQVTLANRAGADRMASPAEQRVRVRLQQNRWVAPSGEDVFCTQTIAPAAVSDVLAGEPKTRRLLDTWVACSTKTGPPKSHSLAQLALTPQTPHVFCACLFVLRRRRLPDQLRPAVRLPARRLRRGVCSGGPRARGRLGL
jgi:hypothetical protein